MPPSLSRSADERRRVARLHELFVLDSEPEPVFDTIAKMASQVCGAPIALISLVDDERQWFKANVGLTGVHETPRDVAFCSHAIEADAMMEVSDAATDARFASNPLVLGQPGIRFYAGAPLVLPDGERVGTLCVIDRQPRRLDAGQLETLRSLAAIATQALTMRRDLIARSLQVRTDQERAVAASEARYRSLVDEQIELVSLARQDGLLVYVNPAYARHFGCQVADMVGKNLYDYIDPADRADVARHVDAVLHSGQSRVGENRMVGADGAIRWVAWTNSVQRDADGQPLLHSVGRDVTDRKRVDEALRASQAFLARTGRVAGVGGWELDLATRAVRWSDETRRIHEVAADHVPSLEGAVAFYAPEAQPVIRAAVQAGLAQGTPWDLELRLVTAKGRSIWVRAVGEVEREGGVPVRLIGAFQDVTQRKALEQRVADNERFVRLITDSLPMRIAYVDRERRHRFANLAHCARFGRERDDILGRTLDDLAGGVMDASIDARLDRVLAGEGQCFEFEEMVDGSLRRIESQMIPDTSATGEVRGVVTTGIDITERSAVERALREVNTIFDNTTDYVVQTDARGTVKYMNPAVRHAVGLGLQEPVEHRNFAEFNTPATNQRFAEVIVPALKDKDVWVGETTVCLAGKRQVPVSHMVIAHRGPSGRIERYSAVMRDISAEVQAQQMLQRQAATLRSVTEAIPAIVAVVGADLRYRFVNGGFERWCGAQRGAIVGRSLAEVLGRAEFERSRPWVHRVLSGETVNFEKAYGGRNVVKHLAISYIPMWLEDGSVDGFVGVAHDISQHRQEQGRLLELVQRDALTGLLNRAGFEEHVERSLAGGHGPSLALLCIDLDRFKPVNDGHGHPVGDQVLQQFASRLLKLVRPTDAVARLGGDEFAIVLHGMREGVDAHKVAHKVVDAAGTPFEVGPLRLSVGASVGVAFGAGSEGGWRDLAARADAMLYRAKDAGRGCIAAEISS